MKNVILGYFLFICLPLVSGQHHFNKHFNKVDLLIYPDLPKKYSLPQLPEGVEQYLQTNLSYPDLARENSLEGEVKLLLLVLPNGKVASAKVLEGIGLGCDEEAIRLVKNMPNWKPATIEGKAIISMTKIKVQFRLY